MQPDTAAPQQGGRLPEPFQLLAFALYLVVVGVGLAGIIVLGGDKWAPGLIPAWLGVVALTGIGHAGVSTLQRVKDVQASVGPANGQTVLESTKQNTTLLRQLAELEKYQHKRNHDIINELTKLQLGQMALLEHLEIVPPDDPPAAGDTSAPATARAPRRPKASSEKG